MTSQANEPIQISPPSTAVLVGSRCHPESFPSWATLVEIDQSPILAISILRGLADRLHLNPAHSIVEKEVDQAITSMF